MSENQASMSRVFRDLRVCIGYDIFFIALTSEMDSHGKMHTKDLDGFF